MDIDLSGRDRRRRNVPVKPSWPGSIRCVVHVNVIGPVDSCCVEVSDVSGSDGDGVSPVISFGSCEQKLLACHCLLVPWKRGIRVSDDGVVYSGHGVILCKTQVTIGCKIECCISFTVCRISFIGVITRTQDMSNSWLLNQGLDCGRVGDCTLPARGDSLCFGQDVERGQERDDLLKELGGVEHGFPTGVSSHAPCDATRHFRRRRLFLGGLCDTRFVHPWRCVCFLHEFGVLARGRFRGGVLARDLALLLDVLASILKVNGVDWVCS